MLLQLEAVSLAFGARPLLDQVSLQVVAGERVCLIGRNGEGKSSLLRLAIGSAAPDEGQVRRAPGIRVALLTQDIADVTDGTVREVIDSGLSQSIAEDEPWVREQRVVELLQRFELDANAQYAQLSGGWRRRVLLARTLASDPQLLLLDEPTNHLDINAIEWLEQLLTEFGGAMLFVSHDRAFINSRAYYHSGYCPPRIASEKWRSKTLLIMIL